MLKPLMIWSVFFFAYLGVSQAASLQMMFIDANTEKPLSYVVVSLKSLDNAKPVRRLPLQVMDQVGKAFVPHVLVVTVGTPVSFPNSDDIRHHLYSFDKPKPFELPLYEGTPTSPIVFDKKGVVRLGCNIHDWMKGYIYIVETPWFAQSNELGKVELQGLPAGEYQVSIWHPRIKARKTKGFRVSLQQDEVYEDQIALTVRKVRKLKKRLRSQRDGY